VHPGPARLRMRLVQPGKVFQRQHGPSIAASSLARDPADDVHARCTRREPRRRRLAIPSRCVVGLTRIARLSRRIEAYPRARARMALARPYDPRLCAST
jgi:hypothetical protein